MPDSSHSATTHCAVLVDYDNFFVGALGTPEQIRAHADRMVALALETDPDLDEIDIRFYGGWLQNGVLTRRASELQAAVAQGFFPRPHPTRPGLLRGSVVLATRLAAVPRLEWAHTARVRRGLPRLRIADGPRPDGCVGVESCPIDLVQRMSRKGHRECHAPDCSVKNHEAFLIQEQKMVDSMLCCDAIAFASQGSLVIVMSDDLDVLPGIAMAAASGRRSPVLVRSSPDAEGLYDEQLSLLGVDRDEWVAA